MGYKFYNRPVHKHQVKHKEGETDKGKNLSYKEKSSQKIQAVYKYNGKRS
jgi:hypothetical protein